MNRSFRFITIFLFIISLNCYPQAPNWSWAVNIGGFNLSWSNDISSDLNGNIYISGSFAAADTIWFGSKFLIGDGILICKYDANGNKIWAKQGEEYIVNIPVYNTCDPFGNVYITGTFENIAIFDTDTLIGVNSDVFLVKYDSSGNLIWAKNLGGKGNDESSSITVDNSGNIYLSGNFLSDSMFFGNIYILGSGTYDAFVVKYDSSGTAVWASKFNDPDYDNFSNGITLDNDKNVLITGRTEIRSAGIFPNFFITKFNNNGNQLWAKGCPSDCNWGSEGEGIVSDLENNSYVIGYGTPTTFDGLTISAGEFFIVKYDSTGLATWAHGVDSGTCKGNAITVNPSGDVFVTGEFGSIIKFGNTILTSVGDTDIFVVKYNSSGEVQWARSAGGINDDYANSISSDIFNNCYITGDLNSPSIPFDSINLINSSQLSNVFISKLSEPRAGVNDNNDKENTILISPNPSNGNFNIELDEKLKDALINIYNVLGGNVFEEESFSSSNEMNLNVPSGIYIVNVKSKNWNYNKKLIIE